MASVRIMTAEQVLRTRKRLAYEIVERNRGADNVVILGIVSRGAALATVLSEEMTRITGQPVPCHPLNVSAFRDDRDSPGTDEALTSPVSLADRDVVLVDDVLFTGRTVRAALDAVIRYGRPRSIQLVVFVDRGHREYPIQPDFVGRTIPTKHRERVVVCLDPDPGVDVIEDL